MIVRLSRGRVRPGSEGVIVGHVERWARELDGLPAGLRGLVVARQMDEQGMVLVAITFWEDFESMVARLGADWTSPTALIPGVAGLLAEARVEHFETMISHVDELLRGRGVEAG